MPLAWSVLAPVRMTASSRLSGDQQFPRESVRAWWLALEFFEYAMDAVPIVKGSMGLRTALQRASLRAMLCIGNAADGENRRAPGLLKVARESLDKSLMLITALVAQKTIELRVLVHARRRVREIFAELDALCTLDVSDWPNNDLAIHQVIEDARRGDDRSTTAHDAHVVDGVRQLLQRRPLYDEQGAAFEPAPQ